MTPQLLWSLLPDKALASDFQFPHETLASALTRRAATAGSTG
jgi:hypothetical protein